MGLHRMRDRLLVAVGFFGFLGASFATGAGAAVVSIRFSDTTGSGTLGSDVIQWATSKVGRYTLWQIFGDLDLTRGGARTR